MTNIEILGKEFDSEFENLQVDITLNPDLRKIVSAMDAAREDGIRIAMVFIRDIIPVSQRTEQLNHVIGELEMFYANYGTDATTYEKFNDT